MSTLNCLESQKFLKDNSRALRGMTARSRITHKKHAADLTQELIGNRSRRFVY